MYKHKTNIDALKENKTSAYQYWKCRDQSLETGQPVATGPRITKLIICKIRNTVHTVWFVHKTKNHAVL